MEFLPPDIAPLHIPNQPDCIPACLDPRRAAEEACPTALASMKARGQTASDLKALDLALNNPEKYELPDFRAYEASESTHGLDTNQVRVRMLAATMPLFEQRVQRSVSEAAIHEAYLGITALAASFSPEQIGRLAARGAIAELAVYGVLLREGRNIPYVTTMREENNSNNFQPMNHDVGAYDSDTGFTNKVPIQIKYSRRKNGAFKANRIMPVFAQSTFDIGLCAYPSLRSNNTDTSVHTVFRLLAQEADAPHDPKSKKARLLHAIATGLHDDIDRHRIQFKNTAYAEGVRRLITDAGVGPEQPLTTAKLNVSEAVRLTDGSYLFFNRLAASYATPERYVTEHRLSFSTDRRQVGSIACKATTGAPITLTEANASSPNDLSIQLVNHLSRSNVQPTWQPGC